MKDGTINYLSLPAITHGLRFLKMYLPFLPLRLSSLLHYLVDGLNDLRHDINGARVAKILSRLPTRRLREIGEQANFGSTVSMHFLDVRYKMIWFVLTHQMLTEALEFDLYSLTA